MILLRGQGSLPERRGNIPIIDLHCSIISVLLENGEPLRSSDRNVSIEKMRSSDVFCQFLAMFICLTDFKSTDAAYGYLKKMQNHYLHEMEQNREYTYPVLCASDLYQNRGEKKLSGILTVEEGGVVDDSPERLEELHDMDVRLITLTWNCGNSLGCPNSDNPAVMGAGLKPLGKRIVERMNELHMLVDVSHLSDGGFWDVMKLTRGPLVVSHSNARTVHDFRRNLTNKMLRALADWGGTTGISLYHKFLGEDRQSSIADMIRHIEHIRKVAGIDVIALGSNFDGFSDPREVRDCTQFYKLTDALTAAGFIDEEIEKICWKNALRVIDSVL